MGRLSLSFLTINIQQMYQNDYILFHVEGLRVVKQLCL